MRVTKALSLMEPYAWLILQRADEDNPRVPLKPIENRPRPLPRTFEVPQRIWIHASLTLFDVPLWKLQKVMTPSQWIRCGGNLSSIYGDYHTYKNDKARLGRLCYFGHILGSIVITGQVTKSDNPWFTGPYGYTLEYPEMLPKAIPYKGKLGFFEVDLNV